MAPNDGVDIGGTVRERAARELRDRILTGVLPAGTRLDLDAITKEFATSRTPVREALLELSYDGLVRVAPRSGITVIGMSPQDVLDSFTILGVLTGQAAAWAAQRVTDDGIARLRELSTEFEVHAGESGIVDANWQFHREIHRAAHSRRLLAQIRQAVRVVPSNFFGMFPDHEHNAIEEHAALVAALADRDSDKARDIAERHVLDAGHSLADWLQQADGSTTTSPAGPTGP
ncbi:GntR family transcriptional regulator [Mycobacterium sp.]|uniref:GntR family transcriptional regulator n=1 Tax=Mycobacterium sp. TaxID=1785 RepID=UPI0025F16774|nr:GntR family transcriptional regulator [Mycobacterium sp.]